LLKTESPKRNISMRISCFIIATWLVLAGTCLAQDRGGARNGGFDPLAMLDRIFQDDENDDGKLSKDEADERLLQAFDRVDADKDGFLNREEVQRMVEQGPSQDGGPGGPEGRGGGLGGPGRPRGGPGRMMAMMPIIQALDADKNGELSTEEIDNAAAAIKTLDQDKDGSISAEEMAPDMSQMLGGGGPGGPGGGMRRGGRTGPPKRPTFD
jgi:Ca2+-binding EF-hand superfamily protein